MANALVCDCAERHAAERRGEFLYLAFVHGWVFDGGPFRTMTPAGRYFRFERDVEDHTGEPYSWVTCPFCGFDLPMPLFPITNWDEGNG
jgi:hypothetical protein